MRVLILMIVVTALAGADDSVACKQTDEILSQLKQIRALLERQPPMRTLPPVRKASLTVGDAPMLGSRNAPLTIVEFTDFQCPFCNRFFEETFPDLKKNYIDSGKVRFYSMDLPLDMLHPNALIAAQAGRCAQDQGQFWPIHDLMQANPTRLAMTALMGYAKQVGIDVTAFQQCIDSGKYKGAIERDAKEATSRGANGTPAFVIGKSTAVGVEGELLIGAQPYATFDEKLKSLLENVPEP